MNSESAADAHATVCMRWHDMRTCVTMICPELRLAGKK